VLRSTIGLKALVVLYDALLGFGIMIDFDSLQCSGQKPTEMHMLAKFTILLRHVLSVIRGLRCLHMTWSGPGDNEFKHLSIASMNSCLIKGGQSIMSHWFVLSRNLVLMGLFSAELYELWRASHNVMRLLQGCPSWYIVSIAGRLCFLTQFMRSHGLLLDVAISWIF